MGAAYRPPLRWPAHRRKALPFSARRTVKLLFLTAVVVCTAAAAGIIGLQSAATAPSNASLFWTPTPTATPPSYQCFRPTDVMIAFDLSDSIDESGKLGAASTAAQTFA